MHDGQHWKNTNKPSSSDQVLFNSNEFILAFLPLTLIAFYLIRLVSRDHSFSFLTLASLFFYGYGEPIFIVILFASVTFNYFIGCKLIEVKSKRLLAFGITINAIAIGYFKYANFFIDSINGAASTHIDLIKVALPLGISFYTFQKIAFLVDAYRSTIKKPKFIEYILFVSFFPQLIAGPITHYNQIEFQLRNRNAIAARSITSGIFLYALGLFKKCFIADFVGAWADLTFNNPTAASPEQSLLGVMAYTLEIYFDFSGYSDMAIGLGMMFGIVLPINFDSPYKSLSIVEFWRRWHITLSTWLREYIYIPLGGKGNSPLTRTTNLMATMLVGGLWHGAAWTFVVWGGLHGLALAINHAWKSIKPPFLDNQNSAAGMAYSAASLILTFTTVSLLWILFRANSFSDAICIFLKLINAKLFTTAFTLPNLSEYFTNDATSLVQYLFTQPQYIPFNSIILFALTVITWSLPNSMKLTNSFKPGAMTALFCALTLFLVVMENIFLVKPNAFIYFRF